MNWIDFIHNPQNFINIYSSIPELDQVQVSGIELGNRLNLRLKFILQDLPDRIPERWRRMKFRAVQVELDFWEIKDFCLSDYEINEQFTFSFSRKEKDCIRFEGKSDKGKIMGLCRSIYVQRVTPI